MMEESTESSSSSERIPPIEAKGQHVDATNGVEEREKEQQTIPDNSKERDMDTKTSSPAIAASKPMLPDEINQQINLERNHTPTENTTNSDNFLESTNDQMAVILNRDRSVWTDIMVHSQLLVRDGVLTEHLRAEFKDHLADINTKTGSRKDLITFKPISDNNFHDLLGCIRGPPHTPYQNGIFFVGVHVDKGYPATPQICQFLTKVYHPNVDEKGKIRREAVNWGSTTGISKLLGRLRGLLGVPDLGESVRGDVAEQYVNDRPEFERIARAYTRVYAMGQLGSEVKLAAEVAWWEDAKADDPAETEKRSDQGLAEKQKSREADDVG